MKRLTIFTSLYNSEKKVKNLYQSLCRQSIKDFVWLTVDDGSTDSTKEVIKEYINEGEIDIIYVYQKNGGKHRAMNRAMQISDTELFVTIDHDDYFVSDAVETILKVWDNTKSEKNLIGMVGYRGKSEIETMHGERFADRDYCQFRELLSNNCNFDTTVIFRTDMAKVFSYPEIEGENWTVEAYLFRLIDYSGFIFKKIEKPLIICEYLPTGLTMSGKFNYPKGLLCYYEMIVNNEERWRERVEARSKCIALSRITEEKVQVTFNFLENLIAFILSPIPYHHYMKIMKR